MDKQVGMVDTAWANAAGTQQNGGANDQTGLASANFDTNAAIKARVQAISAGYYTNARVAQLTQNDLLYAIRLNDNAASIYGK